MKYLSIKLINLFIIILLFLSVKVISQNSKPDANYFMEAIITSGSDASGNSGNVSYSIGQVFFTYIGQKSVYNLAQGIQHQELAEASIKPEDIEAIPQIFIFPNPTADFIHVNMKGFESENGNLTYALFDLQGRIVMQNKMERTETHINVSQLRTSIYILQVYVEKKVLKTFKIIKK